MTQPLFSGNPKGDVKVNPQDAIRGTKVFISCNGWDTDTPLNIIILNTNGKSVLAKPIELRLEKNGSTGNGRLEWDSTNIAPGEYTVSVSGKVEKKARTEKRIFTISEE
jgi:hypothetical protein